MNCLHVPGIWMPNEESDLYKWSVVACDQYTSQPEYWKESEEMVGEAPSTLHMILPEVYLGSEEEEARIDRIHNVMDSYLADGTIQELPKGFMLVERSFGGQYSRNGLVVEVDLETYEYKKGSTSLIRPTEMTVEERIPPRLKVRQTASVELPHIMLLIDDPDCSIIEPLTEKTDAFRKVYDTDLMQGGGHISGWLIPEGEFTADIMRKIENLADPEAFRTKYQVTAECPLLNLAVGDGNHSMATAKAAWENIKKDLTEEERAVHPARYCLCEIVNVHDKSLEIEPIHRVMFGVQEEEFLAAMVTYYEEHGCEVNVREGDRAPYADAEHHVFSVYNGTDTQCVEVVHPVWGIAAATIQNFLDDYLLQHPECKIDYIHGEDPVKDLSKREGNIGILLPDVEKKDLFIGVVKDGVLPRKTFSMGEANEKRYYMECKKLTV